MLVQDNTAGWLRSRLESRQPKFKSWLLSFISCVTFAKLLILSVPRMISDACHALRMGSKCLIALLTKGKAHLKPRPTPGSFQILSLGSKNVSYRTASREALSEDGAGFTPGGFGFHQNGSVFHGSQSTYPEAGGWSPGPVASRFQVGEIRVHGGPLPSLSFAQPAYITGP